MRSISWLLNASLGEFSYHYRQVHAPNFPEVFCVEITNCCNLNCIMCPRNEMQRELRMMDFSLFKKIIDETKSCSRFIWLHGLGEPLMHPQIDKFIKYCRKNGVETGISTNCTLINQKMTTTILNAGLDRIILSLDSATQETYQKIRRNADYKDVNSKVSLFLKSKKDLNLKKPHTTIQLIEMIKNQDEIERFISRWKSENVDQILIRTVSTWANQIESMKELPKQDCTRAVPTAKERYPCKLLWKNVTIFCDGSVVPCCMDFDGKLTLGNVSNSTLLEIWNNERIQGLRRRHLKGDLDDSICQNCTIVYGSPPNPFFPIDTLLLKRMASEIVASLTRSKIRINLVA